MFVPNLHDAVVHLLADTCIRILLPLEQNRTSFVCLGLCSSKFLISLVSIVLHAPIT